MDYRDHRTSAKAITAFAFKVHRRAQQAGDRSHQLEDIKQELWVAWTLAVEAFKPEGGASFSTFLFTGMQRHINRYMKNNVTKRHGEVTALSMDFTFGDDESGSFAEMVPDNAASPSQNIEEQSSLAYAMRRLSPRAQQFVTILRDQPEELLNEVQRLEDKADYAKSRGISMATAHRLTTIMVFDLMDAPRSERRSILDEVEQIGQYICNQAAA